MALDEHARHLGGLIADFHSLEFLLRIFLGKLATARPFGLPAGTDIYLSPVGTDLPENDLTSYESLGQLIDKFNAEMKAHGFEALDRSLVELRDALAHGRVSAAVADDELRLLKFDRPRDGRVRVVFNEVMSGHWFLSQKRRVIAALLYVHSRVETQNPGGADG